MASRNAVYGHSAEDVNSHRIHLRQTPTRVSADLVFVIGLCWTHRVMMENDPSLPLSPILAHTRVTSAIRP